MVLSCKTVNKNRALMRLGSCRCEIVFIVVFILLHSEMFTKFTRTRTKNNEKVGRNLSSKSENLWFPCSFFLSFQTKH